MFSGQRACSTNVGVGSDPIVGYPGTVIQAADSDTLLLQSLQMRHLIKSATQRSCPTSLNSRLAATRLPEDQTQFRRPVSVPLSGMAAESSVIRFKAAQIRESIMSTATCSV